MSKDKWDKQGWCGDPDLYTTSKDDPFNRVCAGHDEADTRELYPGKRRDEIFLKRLAVIEWLYERTERYSVVKAMRKLYHNIIAKIGHKYW
jgi:hypothetical protein